MDIRNYLSKSDNPHKVLKSVIGISVILLLIWLIMISRMDFNKSSEHSDPAKQEQAESIRALVNQGEEEPADQRKSSSGIFMNALTTFLIMTTILVLVWLWVRRQTDDPQKKTFKEIADHTLDADKKLKILEINNEVWILAVSADAVTLLHRYPEGKWKELPGVTESSHSTFYKMFRGQQDV